MIYKLQNTITYKYIVFIKYRKHKIQKLNSPPLFVPGLLSSLWKCTPVLQPYCQLLHLFTNTTLAVAFGLLQVFLGCKYGINL